MALVFQVLGYLRSKDARRKANIPLVSRYRCASGYVIASL